MEIAQDTSFEFFEGFGMQHLRGCVGEAAFLVEKRPHNAGDVHLEVAFGFEPEKPIAQLVDRLHF